MKRKWYVGYRVNGGREIFASASLPTEATHGALYAATWGPFRTKRAALFAAQYGDNNPHLITVNDVERIARHFARKG